MSCSRGNSKKIRRSFKPGFRGDRVTELSSGVGETRSHALAEVVESIGQKVAASTRWTFMGVDPTPAPLGEVSIGAAIESYTGARFGSSGTMTAALIITSAVKAVPLKQVGYSGLAE